MFYAVDWVSLKLMTKFAIIMLGLLMLVFFLAVITPKLAKLIDSRKQSPERVGKKSAYDLDKTGVRSIYDPQADEIKNESGESCDEIDNGDVSEDGKG